MEFHACSSSEISRFGYDLKTGTLALEFHRGGVYSYKNFPEEYFKAFLKSASKGAFFHRFIKGKFEHEGPAGKIPG